MKTATLFNTHSGRLLARIVYTEDQELLAHLDKDIGFIDGTWEAELYAVDLQTGGIVPRAPRLAEFRKKALIAIKHCRTKAELSGCETPLGRVDTDEASQRKISGAVQMALLVGDAFTIEWRMADNSLVTHTKDQMIAMGMAVGQHVAACQQRKNELDAAIEACTTTVEIEALDLTAGWPG